MFGKTSFRRCIFLICLIMTFFVGSVYAHKPSDKPHQTYLMGDFTLENGQVIKDFSMSFVTHGKLNESKTNAILMTPSLLGNHHRIDFLIGPGKALDTDRFFIICADSIGNGLTTSPSNSKVQSGMQFPQYSIRDMVNSQHRFLMEYFDIKHLVAVTGASMGGMQTLQWGVSFPKYMDYLIALTPMAKSPAWSIAVADITTRVVKLDPGWNNGNYSSNPAEGVRLRTEIIAMLASSPEAFKEKWNKPPEDVLKFMKTSGDAGAKNVDANNIIYQTWAYAHHNVGDTPGFGGDHLKALQSVQAKSLLMTGTTDILNPVEEAVEAARSIPGGVYIEVPTVQGHGAATDKSAADVKFMNEKIRQFMSLR